jgi:ABC-type sugar transport system ATPase subunit
MAAIKFINVSKHYGEVIAVENLNLEIKDREFFCLLGPSGCGKSSTLRMVAGLETVTSGEIYIGDTLVNDLEPRERNIAMAFENYALYPHLTVFENIAFPLRVQKAPEETKRKKVEEAAKILDISELLDRRVDQLSGGQQQRVSTGRAIVRNPQVLLLDEPISHLDAKLRDHMRGELKRLQRKLRVTTTYVTHDQIEAMSMADRVAVMNLGLIQQVGTPWEIFNKPANTFVANFVGSPPINIFDSSLKEEKERYLFATDSFKYNLSPEAGKLIAEKAPSPDKLKFGIRPRDVGVHLKNERIENAIPVEVNITEPLGDYTIVDFILGNHIIKAIVSPDLKLEENQRLTVTFPEQHIHVFDAQTGGRIEI